MPVIVKDPSWIYKGSTHVEVRMKAIQGSRASLEVTVGKELWSVTD